MNFKNFLKVFLMCFLLLQQNTLALAQILDGESVGLDKAPFIVQIYENGQFLCGGSLISDNIVLTAANCVEETSLDILSVVGGVEKLNDEGVRSSVTEVLIPKDYNGDSFHMDIAALKLKEPFGNIQKASLCNTNVKKGSTAQLFGWGMVYMGAKQRSIQLRSDIFTVRNKAECAKITKWDIEKSMFCTVGDLRGAYWGYTGGPVLCDDCICGIISSGFKDPKNNFVSIHTSVKYAKSFIDNIMQSK